MTIFWWKSVKSAYFPHLFQFFRVDLRFLFNLPSFHDSALQLQLQLPFPMPLSFTQHSPSIISIASSTIILHSFKKYCTSFGSDMSAVGASGTHVSLSYLPSPANKFCLVSSGNSTRPTLVIDSDEEVDPLSVEKTPEQELRTFQRLNLLSFQALVYLHCRMVSA